MIKPLKLASIGLFSHDNDLDDLCSSDLSRDETAEYCNLEEAVADILSPLQLIKQDNPEEDKDDIMMVSARGPRPF